MYPGVIMCFPDGVTYSKGYVKDLDEAKSYITLDDEVPSSQTGENDNIEQQDPTGKNHDRRTVDLTKNVNSFLFPISQPIKIFQYLNNLCFEQEFISTYCS